MFIKTHKDAKQDGDKFYYTGKRCIRGHLHKRRTANGNCLVCEWQKLTKRAHEKRDHINALRRKRYWKDVEKSREAARDRRQNDENYRKADALRARKFYAENREARIKATKEWCKNNPERAAANKRNYVARKYKAKGSYTEKEVFALLAEQEGICNACFMHLEFSGYHVDHIVPLVKGGSNCKENLQLLCPSCNISKNSLDYEPWLKQRRNDLGVEEIKCRD